MGRLLLIVRFGPPRPAAAARAGDPAAVRGGRGSHHADSRTRPERRDQPALRGNQGTAVPTRTPDPAALAGPTGFTGPWTSAPAIAWQDTKEIGNEQLVLEVGGTLLGLLSLASVSVLVGGRMTEQTRRVGLLKAAGGTPALVTAVLLAEYLALALGVAVIGLIAGRMTAPLLTNFSFFSGLSASPARPPVTLPVIGIVVGAALAVAILATLIPAVRAARKLG